MSAITIAFTVLFYVATIVLIGGLAYRIRKYATTPAPLKIPTTPAPVTRSGVVLRMLREVLFFQSLFRSNKWIWLFGFLFHIALWVVLARHARYFIQDVPTLIAVIQPFGKYAAFAMLIGLIGLLGRRILVDRVRYISAPSDFLMLLLLIGIGVSGAMMTFVAHTDIVMVKAFFLGMMRFDFQPLPGDPLLLIHLALVAVLMIIFPISKLLHAPGVFFSPTRNQVDNPRERRHIAGWARDLEAAERTGS